MAWGSVTLIPGVSVESTPTLSRASINVSQLIRYKSGLPQKYGGWNKFYPFALSGTPRALHAWDDLNGTSHLAIGTTTSLNVVTNSSLQDITPQVKTTNFAPNVSTTSGSALVNITDPNISNVTILDAVFFDVPISLGGVILDGLYQITEITGAHSFDVTAATNATATCTNPLTTSAATLAGSAVLTFASVPAWVVAGMVVADITASAAIPANTTVLSTTGTTITISNNVVSPGVGIGDSIVIANVPVFTTTNGSATVSVKFIAHGLTAGETVSFSSSTTGNGVTISGSYDVATVTDANTFTIAANTQATASGSFAANSGQAQLTYYIALGPPALGAGYGLGTYGTGGYGTGVLESSQTGTDLAATDYTLDNWGELLISCPTDGPIFYWGPNSGYKNSSIISEAPPFNTGAFVSMAQQILIAYGSAIHKGLGYQQQPLLVQWTDVGNLFQWTALSTTQAGNYTIPVGSKVVGGMAVQNQNLLWTDIDLWSMAYSGYPYTFSFNKIGSGAGLVSKHAAQQLRGGVYWMGSSNFYRYTSGGVEVIPCPVWDFVFQNLNSSYTNNIRAMPNTLFDEVGWLFPSSASANGECDSYVKFNIAEPNTPWDYGSLPRSAWIDQSVFGTYPIAASPTGIIYNQENGNDADGSPLAASFTTGYFYLGEGEDFVFVDQIFPDFKWSTYSGSGSAQIQLTFSTINFMGDTPTSYGPYTVTSATEYLSVRIRARQMSVTISSADTGSFWRIGHIRYRYAAAGRR